MLHAMSRLNIQFSMNFIHLLHDNNEVFPSCIKLRQLEAVLKASHLPRRGSNPGRLVCSHTVYLPMYPDEDFIDG
jgi:hypothetical protein